MPLPLTFCEFFNNLVNFSQINVFFNIPVLKKKTKAHKFWTAFKKLKKLQQILQLSPFLNLFSTFVANFVLRQLL